MTHAPRHVALKPKRVSLTHDMTVRRAVSAGMTVAIPSVGAVVAAAPSMAAPDATSSAAPASTASAAAPTTHATIMYGSRGADVVTIQKALNVSPVGVFGPLTLAAVKAYQKAHGLVADGVVGPLTWASISGSTTSQAATTSTSTPASSTATKPATTTTSAATTTSTSTTAATAPGTVKLGSTGDAVKVLQSKLSLSITGTFSSDVQTAVKSYQSAHGLVADGIVGPLTWGKLAVSASDVTRLAPTLTVVTASKPATVTPAATTTPAVTTPTTTAPATTTPVVTTPATTTTTASTAGSATTVAVATTSVTADQIIAYAKNYLGVPYLWGGSTPAGFDCSGLTSYVFSHFGYTIPRTAAQQQAYFPATSNPQPGDLLFYGYPAYHVAIYLGNGMMLDDNHPGGSVGVRAIYGTPSGYARVINR